MQWVTSLDHEAEIAYTLSAGLDKALSSPFDVVFLDVRLPDGSGLDALDSIKTTPFFPGGDHYNRTGGPGRRGSGH